MKTLCSRRSLAYRSFFPISMTIPFPYLPRAVLVLEPLYVPVNEDAPVIKMRSLYKLFNHSNFMRQVKSCNNEILVFHQIFYIFLCLSRTHFVLPLVTDMDPYLYNQPDLSLLGSKAYFLFDLKTFVNKLFEFMHDTFLLSICMPLETYNLKFIG